MEKRNITLIGMAGAGKSSVGLFLAESLGWQFVDIDKLFETERSKSLQEILDEVGEEQFVKLESEKVREFSDAFCVVLAPGGSIVYSPQAMKTLKDISIVLYLAVDPKALKTRIEASTRGIVGLKSKSFEDLYSERENLYMKYADFVIDANNKSPEQLAQEIAILIIPRSVEMIE